MLSITNTMPEAYAKIKGNKKVSEFKGNGFFLWSTWGNDCCSRSDRTSGK